MFKKMPLILLENIKYLHLFTLHKDKKVLKL